MNTSGASDNAVISITYFFCYYFADQIVLMTGNINDGCRRRNTSIPCK